MYLLYALIMYSDIFTINLFMNKEDTFVCVTKECKAESRIITSLPQLKDHTKHEILTIAQMEATLKNPENPVIKFLNYSKYEHYAQTVENQIKHTLEYVETQLRSMAEKIKLKYFSDLENTENLKQQVTNLLSDDIEVIRAHQASIAEIFNPGKDLVARMNFWNEKLSKSSRRFEAVHQGLQVLFEKANQLLEEELREQRFIQNQMNEAAQKEQKKQSENTKQYSYPKQFPEVVIPKEKSEKEVLIFEEYTSKTFNLNKEEQYLLKSWLNAPNLQIKLLYRASRDGFSGDKFHQLCDNKGSTLSLIKSEHGKVFGGYTSRAWKQIQNIQFFTDENAFIFSLTHRRKFGIRVKHQAIKSYPGYFLLFGAGSDIFMTDNCDKNQQSGTNFPVSYEGPDNETQPNDYSKSYLAGSYNFRVLEIEVYQVSL